MKIKMNILALILLASVQAFANNDVQVTEKRISAPFHFIQVKGNIHVTLVENEAPEIELKGTPQQLQGAVTLLKNDVLYIYTTAENNNADKLSIRVNINDLKGLTAKQNAVVSSEGPIRSDKFSIQSEGGSIINLDVNKDGEKK